jgi:hypothetical protein
MLALRKCDQYLRRPGRHVLQTDHGNLKWMNHSNDKVRPTLCRWAAELQSHDLTIEHIPGAENVPMDADALSRVFAELPTAPIAAAQASTEALDGEVDEVCPG